MKELLDFCAKIFDKSPQPFGIAHVLLDDQGNPIDFTYAYLNPSMAAMTNQKVEDLQGVAVYQHWADSDPTWVEYFYRAAYEETSVEFESVSVVLDQFLDVVAFPITTGYCGFLIQDVTDWMGRAQLTLQNAEAGFFFFDRRTQIVLLTPVARRLCGTDRGYLPIKDFLFEVFGDQGESLMRDVQRYTQTEGRMLYEGQLEDGRWLRFSISHTGLSDRFIYGFLEDITRTKMAELESERHSEIVNLISRENYALHIADLTADHVEPYQDNSENDQVFLALGSEGMSYSAYIAAYIDTCVAPEDQTLLQENLNRSALLERLESQEEFSLTYRRIFNEEPEYVELRIIRLADPHVKAIFAARNINDEILEQLRQHSILEEALRFAEQANKTKSSFLTNMSHDLRTPLNAIAGFAQLALEHKDDPQRVGESLEKIIISSEHLLDLVNDILDFSRIESGKIPMNDDSLDLVAWCKSLESLFSETALTQSVNFSFKPGNLLHSHVIADRVRLNQILVNTIGNALKFTPQGGNVNVKVEELQTAPKGYGVYRFTIHDTGCGMTPEFLNHIFEPFEREELARTHHVPGTGLGMTITKNLVRAFNGSIDVQSTLNVGTDVTIVLPLKLASMDSSAVQPTREFAKNLQDVPTFEGVCGLVVDDDDLSREIAAGLLEEHGIAVEEASDGDEAFDVVKASPTGHFDFIIMDLRMPRLSGDEATKLIRSLDRPDTKVMPIIATTADAFDGSFRRAQEAGMTAHLTKPLNLRLLLEELAKQLDLAKKNKSLLES